MKYLRLKNSKKTKKTRKNGTRVIVPIMMEKSRRMGRVISEEVISRKSPVLITGAHASGKTRMINRLFEHALDIWGGQAKAKGRLHLSGLNPLSEWYEAQEVREWWEKSTDKEEGKQTWSKLKAWEKAGLLPSYCKDTNGILFIDDAHLLTKRKADIARQCLFKARLFVVSASEENRIPVSLRKAILSLDPQEIRLDSDASYDATNALIWVFLVLSIAVGAYEVGVVLGGLKMLGRGRRAGRED